MKKYKNAFTLIEVIVAITIFIFMFISIFAIYRVSTDINYKADINRFMQENIKNLHSSILEDIRESWIQWVSEDILDDCNMDINSTSKYKKWTKLCINWWNSYYLAKKAVLMIVIWELMI